VLLFFFLGGWIAVLERDMNQLERIVLTQIKVNPSLITESCSDPALRILAPETAVAIPIGTTIPLLGTADYPTASRYEVSVRPANSTETWERVSVRRFDQPLGAVGRWNTRNKVAGIYDVRLTAVRRSNTQFSELASCQIQIELTQ
jgi:hypothetical protein